MDLGKAIKNHLQSVFQGSEMRDTLDYVISEIFDDNMRILNEQGLEPSGRGRADLKESYAEHKTKTGLNEFSDFLYSGNARDSFESYGEEYPSEDARGVSFDYSEPSVSDYMRDHEQGSNGMPQRRLYPVEGDTHTLELMQGEIEQAILEVFQSSTQVISI